MACMDTCKHCMTKWIKRDSSGWSWVHNYGSSGSLALAGSSPADKVSLWPGGRRQLKLLLSTHFLLSQKKKKKKKGSSMSKNIQEFV